MCFFFACLSRWVAVLAAFLALVTTSLVNAQICGIPGMIGNAAVSAAVNTYFAGSGTPAAGTSSVALLAGATSRRGVAVNLVAGDLVLIMQMQDNDGTLAGNYEYAVVTVGGGVGATIQLASNLVNSYAQTITAATGVVRTFQVIRVPQYSTATLSGTINVLPWFVNPVSGAGTGGVFAVDVAGLLTSNGVTINANARGFRGGLGVNSASNRAGGGPLDNDYACDSGTLNGSYKGEGTAGIPKRVLGFNTGGTAGAATTYDAVGELYTVAANRGFLNGSCGRGAQGNSGGGGNDGVPPTNTNGQNSGGGGGGNVGVGGAGGNSWNSNNTASFTLNQTPPTPLGLGGWPAGGRGGLALAPAVATKLYLGGGAGSANNASADVITTFPPSAPGAPPAANGATGGVTSSGAAGGGVVIWRAGAVTISAASTINAQGAHAYTKAPNGDTDSGGGGGAGGTVVIDNASGSLANLTINAFGGIGGSSNYFNHGPGGGGGGGGGLIFTRGTGATTSVIAGTPGTDGCCGGTGGNNSPKNYEATAGAVGAVTTSGVGNPPGSSSGAQCLPNLTVNKVTTTPLITAATGATAQFTLNVRNTGGAATNVFLYDTGLPPGWAYSATPAATFAYSPAPPLAGGAFAAGAETTLATGVASPPVLPVNTYTAFNTSPLSLRAAATAPGRTPTVAQGSLTFGSFFIPQNGSISVTYAVTIPNTATVGTYHNGAGASFLDPTRSSNVGRAIAMATNISANRNSLAYSSSTTFQTGGTTTVAGSHYSGLVAGPTGEDVRLLPDISITKTGSASAPVNAIFNYTLTPRNNGRAIAVQVFNATQATDVALANLGTVLGASPLSITDTLPTGVFATNTFAGTNWVCSGTSPIVCTLPDANAFPVNAATNFAAVTGTVRVTCLGGSGKTNTAVVSPGAGETLLTNNTGTFTTTITPGCVNATLTIAKFNSVVFPATLLAGQTTSYTITVANLGPGAAGGTTLRDSPSLGLSCTTNPTCTATAGAACPGSLAIGTLLGPVGLVIPTLGSGSTVTFALTCGVTATGLP
jgi:uncharacterized repeat protein (TIGR01451 family)